MTDLVERLLAAKDGRAPHPFPRIDEMLAVRPRYAVHEHDLTELVSTITALREENERLRAALELYRDAVRIDATMEGPKFMGANSSALKRAWDADLAALEEGRT